MKQTFTLHTHTIGFDGRNTILEMANRAKELGFDTIGISNHFIVHPTIKQSKMYEYAVHGGYSNIYDDSFDSVITKFQKCYDQIEEAQALLPNIKILRGMETDFFNNSWWRDNFENAIKILKPDYIIGSAHFIEYNGNLLNSHDWKNADKNLQQHLLTTYWANIGTAAQSKLFSWMAHLDLPKKVGLGLEKYFALYEYNAVEQIKKSNTAVEINTGLYTTQCYEPYPSKRILEFMKDKEIPVLISDDAHKVDDIGRHFDEAKQLIEKYSLNKFCFSR